MKRKAEAALTAMARAAATDDEDHAADGEDASHPSLPLAAFSGDVSAALAARYGRSAAPQHRHLLASTAAMRSILIDGGLPLSPSSYLSAALSALASAGPGDPSAAAALAAFLAILLPHVPADSLPPPEAKDAAAVLASFLMAGGMLPTGTVRSVVKSLGLLVLRTDAEDWEAAKAPLDALLTFSVDWRPKVRKCAQEYVEKFFDHLKGSGSIKKASTVVLGMFEKHIELARRLGSDKTVDSGAPKPEETEALHMFNMITAIVRNLSKKVRKKISSETYHLLSRHFNVFTRNVLKLMETLLEHVKVEHIDPEVENFVSALVAYLSYGKKKPADTIVAALHLLKNCLRRLIVSRPNLWAETLPVAFKAASGYLILNIKPSNDIADILKECIDMHIDRKALLAAATQLGSCSTESSCDANAIKSICLSFNSVLTTCDRPSDSILTVISVLFLRLGETSYFFMKEILLKLSEFTMNLDKELPISKHVQECIGCAVIAMGPEKILSLIPVALDKEKLICSNMWLTPILRRYIFGASLQLFLEYIVPLVRSLQKASCKVKEELKHKGLQTCVDSLWNLLPAFCRYPSDISQNYGSLSKLLIEVLKDDPSLHEATARALQELVDGTRRLLSGDQHLNISEELPVICSSQIHDFGLANLGCCSKKNARKNMKVLVSHSMDLIWTLADVFFDSSPEKRAYLKDALRCLASLSGSVNIRSLFLSLLKRFGLENTRTDSETPEYQTHDVDGKEEKNTDRMEEINDKRPLLMELISTFVEAADEDLIDLFFGFIKSSLLNDNGSHHSEALFALSIILKEHSGFCLAQMDEIMMLLHSIRSHSDSTVLKWQLSCYQHLLVRMLKVNEESMNKKAFLILNKIILTLKSKKGTRRLAYDALLATSSSLKNTQSSNADSDLQRLFSMVMGYLSSPSPHIVSGAIAALSLLIYNDANFCLGVPNLIPSVLVLLQQKAIEVIKAALGFIKVLVSSLQSEKLLHLQADIVNGMLPWSSVSKHHFRAKVAVILEILIRKCGFDTLDLIVPEKYKAFVTSIAEGHHNKKNPTGSSDSEEAEEPSSGTIKRIKKLHSDDVSSQEKKHHGAPSKNRGKGKKQKMNFFVRKETQKKGPRTANNGHRRRPTDKGNRSNLKFTFQAQPGDIEKDKNKTFKGGNRSKMKGTKYNKRQNHVVPVSKDDASLRFKKHRTAVTTQKSKNAT